VKSTYTAAVLSRQGHRLLQVGVALFLFTSLEGFGIPHLAVPRLGLSIHTLSALERILLLVLGLVWPRHNLGVTMSRVAFWFLLYSIFAILAAYVMASAGEPATGRCRWPLELHTGRPCKRL
jgi:hydroxylaminobenzene mutase